PRAAVGTDPRRAPGQTETTTGPTSTRAGACRHLETRVEKLRRRLLPDRSAGTPRRSKRRTASPYRELWDQCMSLPDSGHGRRSAAPRGHALPRKDDARHFRPAVVAQRLLAAEAVADVEQLGLPRGASGRRQRATRCFLSRMPHTHPCLPVPPNAT